MNRNLKAPWRILNYMMFYLAENKQKASVSMGRNDHITDWLEQIKGLNVVDDSARVGDLYDRIFAEENMQAGPGGETGSFIDAVLAKRLDQVIRWGFEVQTARLNELGEFITRLGPMTALTIGEKSIEGEVRAGETTFYVKAAEDKYLGYRVTEVIEGGFVALRDRSGTKRCSEEPSLLKLQIQHLYSVPVDYEELAVRDMRLTCLPCPAGDPWQGIDSGFFERPWSNWRIVMDLYGNIKDFRTKDSLGMKRLPITLEYNVQQISSLAKGGETLAQAVNGREELNFDVSAVGKTGGFRARVLTGSLQPDHSYRVEICVSNSGLTFKTAKIVDIAKQSYPLEIIDHDQTSTGAQIPPFELGPISKEKELQVFFAVDGLHRRDPDGTFSGVAYLLLTDPGSRRGNVDLSDTVTFQWEDSMPPIEDGSSFTSDAIASSFERVIVDTLQLMSRYPRGYFICQARLPDWARSGSTKKLTAAFYSHDPEKNRMEYLGFGERIIQVK